MLVDAGVPVRALPTGQLCLLCPDAVAASKVTLVLDSAAAFIMERVDMVRHRCSRLLPGVRR